MFGNTFLILAAFFTALAEASEVSQLQEKIEVLVGQDARFQCFFSLVSHVNKIRIYWWKRGEREFFKKSQDPRKTFRMESKASSSFLLQKVRFGDAGIYYCRAEGEVTGNGTGTNLIVMVSPEPLTISPKQPADGSLICRTSGFYPEDYSLSWFKNGQKITDGVTTRTQKTAEGLSEAVSYLKDSEPAQHGTVYGCKVVHSTLKIPALANYIVSSEGITISFPWWIYLCGGIFLLLLIALTLIYCKFCKYKVRKDKFQVKACVRCTQPIVTRPEYEKRNDVNDDILMISTDPSKSEVTNGPPKAKKHRKRKCDPMLV